MSENRFKEQKILRFNVLAYAEEKSKNNRRAIILRKEVAEALGVDPDALTAPLQYLEGEGLIKFSIGIDSFEITHLGVLEVEDALANPQERTEHFLPVAEFRNESTRRPETVLRSVVLKSKGKKSFPTGTKLKLSIGTLPGAVDAEVSLPGQVAPTVFNNLEINEGVAEVPVKVIFLCHAKENAEAVKEIGTNLRLDGFLTWFDEDDLLPGDDWKARIEDAIETSNYVLVFLSSASITKTGYVQREIKYALEQRQLRPEVLSKVVDEARVSASSFGVIKQPSFLFPPSVVLRRRTGLLG